jgi:DNA-directed RNA polymerase
MCGINVDTDALVRKYEPLILSVLAKKLPAFIGDDDLIQAGRIALWRSAKRYDPDKGKFSTYAYKVIYHAMLKELGRRKNEVSLNAVVPGEEECELQDLIPDPKSSLDGAEIRFELEDFYKTLTPRRQEIMKLKISGETRKNIAEHVGISFEMVKKELQAINKQWRAFRKKIEEEEE